MGTCASTPETSTIVLLGRTGDGKSSAGNTILGEKVFTSNSVKDGHLKAQKRKYGRNLKVVEMPGFFDADCDAEETKSKIIKSLVECAQGVDAFVIVLKAQKYTQQEIQAFQQRLNTLKKDVFDHIVILFTFGEQLEGKTVKEFTKDCSELQALADKCGGRHHVIDSKHWKRRKRGYRSNKAQVKDLLETIDEMRNKNGCYTNEVLQKLEEEIQEEMKNNESDLSPEEKRERAKENVQNKLLVKAAGVATGVLIGACFGALASIFLQVSVPLRALLNVAAFGVGATGANADADGKAGEADNKTGEKAGGAEGIGAAVGAAVAKGGVASTAVTAVLRVAAITGGVLGGIAGYEAAEEADSVYDAMVKAAKHSYDKAMTVIGCDLVTDGFNNKQQTKEDLKKE